nr:F-box only protein 39-like [Ciona intestinalis]|eukprot:XP_002122397.1 F-box only protein 39-like [Ciona intestinalis]
MSSVADATTVEIVCEETKANTRPQTPVSDTKSWDNLPHVSLIKIFTYLKESQLLELQFVCKRWYDVIRHTPSLWREKYFRFSGREPRDLTHQPYRYATHFIRTFGKYLHVLEFRLHSPVSTGVCKKFQVCVKVCLNHLAKSRARIKVLSLPMLQLDRSQWMLYKEDFCSALAKFFCKSQHSMRDVCLRGARANFDDGYKVLYAMGYNTGDTVTRLDLEDFFGRTPTPVYDKPQFVDCLKNFTNLQELDLNYSCLSEELLDGLAEKLNPDSLRWFYIKVYAYDPHNQVVWGHSWGALVKKCPSLKVNMLFQRVMTSDEHFRILLPQIPLSQVSFDGCYFADQSWQLYPTIASILPLFKKHLRRITIDLPDTREVFENELLTLIQHCDKLVSLKLYAFITSRFVDRLLQMVQDGKSKLEIIKIRIYLRDYDTQDEESELDRIFAKYERLVGGDLNYYASCVTSI